MRSIALICPYFGEFKGYFDFFLKSCEKNPSIDFYFFTDNGYSSNISNLHFIPMTLEEVKKRTQKYFDFPINLENPYKLCDFKPVYGLIFGDYISRYDYWGHCDTDMIFGNIRHFLTDELLENYDRVLMNGMLTLYRNNDAVNNIFRQSPFCKQALSNAPIMKFDEGGYTGTSIFWLTHLPDRIIRGFEFFSDPKARKKSFTPRFPEDVGSKLVSYDVESKDGWHLYKHFVQNGILEERELLYVHFNNREFSCRIDPSHTDYSIIPNKFVPPIKNTVGKIDKTDLLKRCLLCYRPFYLSWHFQRICKKIKKYYYW